MMFVILNICLLDIVSILEGEINFFCHLGLSDIAIGKKEGDTRFHK